MQVFVDANTIEYSAFIVERPLIPYGYCDPSIALHTILVGHNEKEVQLLVTKLNVSAVVTSESVSLS